MNSSPVPSSSSSRKAPEAGAPAGSADTAENAPALSARRAAELDGIFAANGLLARAIEGYRPRVAQAEMARAVAAAMEALGQDLPEAARPGDGDDTLIVEAGTGTGKTFAYLVPAMLWGGKVIISTGTKHLQDQLFQRDIPTMRDALAVPVTVAMLKGRANYLCHYYLQRTADGARLPSRQDTTHLQEILHFAKITHSGDKAELASVPETSAVWSMVTSTRENCLGQECQHYRDCFVMHARREAQQADIVVVNHHLFFADIALRDTGMAELLPSANTIIFDEAHQLPETATLFFGETLSTSQFLELARDCVAEGLSHARDAVEWVKLGAALERAARDVRLSFRADSLRLSMAQLPVDHPLFRALAALATALDTLTEALAAQAERAESLDACWRRAQALQAVLACWTVSHASDEKPGEATPRRASSMSVDGAPATDADNPGQTGQPEQNDMVRWIEVFAQTVQLHETPLSVAPIFARQRAGVPRTWIFTSATLSVRGDFTHYAAQMGLNTRRSITLPSPFDYPSQALLYVPRSMPQPSSPQFTDAVFEAALPVIEASGGGVFMLCTTLRAVDRIAMRLRGAIEARGWNMPLLVQGDASRTELLERFRDYGNALLVGSQSFWEGVDVRGDALALVVIDKLPFAPPDDPVLSARLDALTKKGLSPFVTYQLPQAVITLKQGAGRLIRAETDRGVLMICDTRLVDKPYGRRIWQSLPPFRRTRDIDEVKTFLAALEQASSLP